MQAASFIRLFSLAAIWGLVFFVYAYCGWNFRACSLNDGPGVVCGVVSGADGLVA